MTEQPGQPKRNFCLVCGGFHGVSEPHDPSYYKAKPDPAKGGLFGPPPKQEFGSFSWPPPRPEAQAAKDQVTDAMLQALGLPPKAGERPPVELPADRRAHIVRRAAEFKEWVANGLTRGEALGIVAMEIQLEDRHKRREEGS